MLAAARRLVRKPPQSSSPRAGLSHVSNDKLPLLTAEIPRSSATTEMPKSRARLAGRKVLADLSNRVSIPDKRGLLTAEILRSSATTEMPKSRARLAGRKPNPARVSSSAEGDDAVFDRLLVTRAHLVAEVDELVAHALEGEDIGPPI